MGRRNRKVRYLDEISKLKELREARKDIKLQLWQTEEMLAEDVSEAFSVDNLLEIIAPRGSVADKVVGGINSGIATVRGVIKGIQMFRNSRW